jgi:hypothetical protein
MAGSEKFLVWIFPVVVRKLGERYSEAPLKEILQIVRDLLATRALEGKKAPFPYAPGVLLLTVEEQTTQGPYRISPLYELATLDHAVEVLDVGVVELEAGDDATG